MNTLMATVSPVIIASLTFCLLAGCGTPPPDECVQKLSEKIPVGSSQQLAEEVLGRCGFVHSFDQKTSLIQASKPARRGWFIDEDWSVRIVLDEARRVKSVEIKKLLTGP